ncbi:MAG: DUF4129 domain-containing protein [Flavisolibacter sp.]
MRKTILIIVIFLQVIIPVNSLAQYQDTVFTDSEVFEEEYTVDDDYRYFNLKPLPQKIQERKIDEQTIGAIKSEEDYWYADLAPEKKQVKPSRNTSINFNFAEALFWILVIGGFIAFLVWFLANNQIGLFRKSRIENPADVVEEFDNEDIFSIKYDQEIPKAISTGNFRMAVRLLYLQTLKEMTERNIIRYGHEKTNSDYLFQLHKSRYYDRFFRLTRHFDYTWYGGFNLDEQSFGIVKNEFITFKQQLA